MDKESELVVAIAQSFFNYVSVTEPSWDEAYLRYNGDEKASGLTSTFLSGSTANYIDADDELEFDVMSEITEQFKSLQNTSHSKFAC